MQIGDTIWAVIYKYDSPKEVLIIDIINEKNRLRKYKVQYKNKIFEVLESEVFIDKESAEIFWIMDILDFYEYYKSNKKMFSTNEVEIAHVKAHSLIHHYIDTQPELILKYL